MNAPQPPPNPPLQRTRGSRCSPQAAERDRSAAAVNQVRNVETFAGDGSEP